MQKNKMVNEKGTEILNTPELGEEPEQKDPNADLAPLFAEMDFHREHESPDIEQIILANMGTIHLFADSKDALRLLGGYILPKAEIIKVFTPQTLSLLAQLQTLEEKSTEREEVNKMLRTYFGALENQRHIVEAQAELHHGLEQITNSRSSERN